MRLLCRWWFKIKEFDNYTNSYRILWVSKRCLVVGVLPANHTSADKASSIIFCEGYRAHLCWSSTLSAWQHTSICCFDNGVTIHICFSIRMNYSICSVCLSLPCSRQCFAVLIICLWFQSPTPCFTMEIKNKKIKHSLITPGRAGPDVISHFISGSCCEVFICHSNWRTSYMAFSSSCVSVRGFLLCFADYTLQLICQCFSFLSSKHISVV